MISAVHTEVGSASGAWWSSAANAAAVVPALVDVVGDGLALLDHHGCFLGLNPPAVEVLGRPEAELVGLVAPFAISSVPQPSPGFRTTTWTGSGARPDAVAGPAGRTSAAGPGPARLGGSASPQARTGLAVDVQAPADLRLDLDLDAEEDLYRIVSEALHNVVKHARATAVKICFAHAVDGGVAVEVTDDGCGSGSEVGAAGTRLGLVSMRERTQRVGRSARGRPAPERGLDRARHPARPCTDRRTASGGNRCRLTRSAPSRSM
jgi:hypothetical protein